MFKWDLTPKFFNALENNDRETMTECVRKGFKINKKYDKSDLDSSSYLYAFMRDHNYYEITPVFGCVIMGYTDVLKCLFKSFGADPNQTVVFGKAKITPMGYAVTGLALGSCATERAPADTIEARDIFFSLIQTLFDCGANPYFVAELDYTESYDCVSYYEHEMIDYHFAATEGKDYEFLSATGNPTRWDITDSSQYYTEKLLEMVHSHGFDVNCLIMKSTGVRVPYICEVIGSYNTGLFEKISQCGGNLEGKMQMEEDLFPKKIKEYPFPRIYSEIHGNEDIDEYVAWLRSIGWCGKYR